MFHYEGHGSFAQQYDEPNYVDGWSSNGGIPVLPISCVFCGAGHLFDSCPYNPDSICYMGNYSGGQNSTFFNNPYSQVPHYVQTEPQFNPSMDSYSHGMEWLQEPSDFSQQSWIHQPEQQPSPSIESLMKEFCSKFDPMLQSQADSLRNLGEQIEQMERIASALNQIQQDFSPSDVENPKNEDMEDCKPIESRSGKKVDQPGEKKSEDSSFEFALQEEPETPNEVQVQFEDIFVQNLATLDSTLIDFDVNDQGKFLQHHGFYEDHISNMVLDSQVENENHLENFLEEFLHEEEVQESVMDEESYATIDLSSSMELFITPLTDEVLTTSPPSPYYMLYKLDATTRFSYPSNHSSVVGATSRKFFYHAKLEGNYNQDPWIVSFDTFYGRKPLFDEWEPESS